MRRTVSINSEWHTLLTNGKLQCLPRLDAGISIEHLDLTLITEINLSLITNLLCYISCYIDTGRTHLKSSLPFLGLVFILRTDGSTYLHCLDEFRHIVSKRTLF